MKNYKSKKGLKVFITNLTQETPTGETLLESYIPPPGNCSKRRASTYPGSVYRPGSSDSVHSTSSHTYSRTDQPSALSLRYDQRSEQPSALSTRNDQPSSLSIRSGLRKGSQSSYSNRRSCPTAFSGTTRYAC